MSGAREAGTNGYGPVARTTLVSHVVAAVTATVAVLLGRVLLPLTDSALYALLIAAVAIAVWYGGFVPGLLAVAVGWSLGLFVLVPGAGLGLDERVSFRWALSLAAALLVVWVSVVMRRGHERAATAAVVAERTTREMEALQELAAALSSAMTPSEVARELVQRTPGLAGARGGALGLIEGAELVIVDPGGVGGQTHRPGLRLPLETRAPITRAAAEGRIQRASTRADLEARFPDAIVLTAHAQAAVAVPLRVGDDVVGSMSFHFSQAELAVREEAEAILRIAADLGSRALERARFDERERRSRRALDRIIRVAPRLYHGTPEEMSVAVCREARKTLGADLAEIWRIDPHGRTLELESRDPGHSLDVAEQLEVAQLPGLRESVEHLEVTFLADVQDVLTGDLLEYARRSQIASWLWAPIVIGGRAERLLSISWRSAAFEADASTIVLARRFSDHAGLALEQQERRQAEEEAARAAQETRRLLNITEALAAAATPTEVTGAILEEGLGSLGASAGVVVSRTDDGAAVEIVDSRAYERETLEPWRRIPTDARMPIADAVRENRLIALESPEDFEARYPDVAGAREARNHAWLCLPLSAGGSVLGAVGFSFSEPRRFSDADLEFAQALARQSGQALERALLLAAEYQARTHAEDMVVLASSLSQTMSPADVVDVVGSHLVSLVRADVSGIYLLGDDSALHVVDVIGRMPPATEPERIPLSASSALAESARLRRTVWVDSAEELEAFADDEPWRAAGIASLLTVPLQVEERPLGVLVVGFEREHALDEGGRALVASVCRQAVQPLERSWLMEREQSARVAAEIASRRTRRLQSTTQALAAAPSRRDVATILVGEAIDAVAGDGAALYAFDAERESPEILATIRVGAEHALGLTAAVIPAALAAPVTVIDTGTPGSGQAHELRSAIEGAGFRSAACLPLGVGARVVGALLVCFQTREHLPEEDTVLLQTLARIGAQALERSRLFDEEQRVRVRSERLQQMTAALSSSLTQRDVAEVVVDALVQGFGAHGAALSAVVEERQLQQKLAWRGYEDAHQDAWLEIPLDARTPGNEALRNRTAIFYETLDVLAEAYPVAAESMRATGHESFFFVPLVVGGATNGLVVTSWRERVAVSSEDRVFLETLASQAAQALDRARRYESERTIAETLQRSVLPMSLPRVDSVQLAARYLPGTEEVDVGGDWFDAIPLPNGRLGLVVGDVVGKGVQSAATMAQLRNALRAFALDQMKPSSTVTRLNRLIEEMAETSFATLVYAVVDAESGTCRLTSAGHPPPLVVFPDGTATFIEGGRGLPLGTGGDSRYRQESVDLPVGSTLVLYTDGLIERRSEPIDDGLERLRLAAEESRNEPGRLVEHILDRLVGQSARGDDVAVLAVRLLAVPPKPLELRLPRSPRSLELVRDALRVWLQHAPATQNEAHEIVLASWEACANAVEHPDGANGSYTVTAELESSTVRVLIRDSGRWLPETERPDRGLGLRLIRSVMSSVEIDTTEEGTLVRLEKRLADEDLPARTAR